MAFSSTEEMKQHTERLHHAHNSRQAKALGKSPAQSPSLGASGQAASPQLFSFVEAEEAEVGEGARTLAIEDKLARVVRKISSVSHFHSKPGIASLVEVMAAMGGSPDQAPGSPAKVPSGMAHRKLFPQSAVKTQPRMILEPEGGGAGEDASLEIPANTAKVINFLAAHKAAGASIKEMGIATPGKVKRVLEESGGRMLGNGSDSEEPSDSAVAEASASRRARRLTVARGSGGAGTGGGGSADLSSSYSASLDQASESLRARRQRVLRRRKGGGGSGMLADRERPAPIPAAVPPQPTQQSSQPPPPPPPLGQPLQPIFHPAGSAARAATSKPGNQPAYFQHQQQQQQLLQQQAIDKSPDLISQAYNLTRQISSLPSISPQMRSKPVTKSVSILSVGSSDDRNQGLHGAAGSSGSLLGSTGAGVGSAGSILGSPTSSPSRPIFFNLSQARPSRARAESLTLKELEFPDVEKEDDSLSSPSKSSLVRRGTAGSRGRAMSILDDDSPSSSSLQQPHNHPQPHQPMHSPSPPSRIPESAPLQARLTSPASKLKTATFAAAENSSRKPSPPRRPVASSIETVVFVKPQDILHPKRVKEKPVAEGANLVPNIPSRLPSRQSLKTPTGLPAGAAHRKWQSTIIRPVSSLHHLRGLVLSSTGAVHQRPSVVQRELWLHHGVKIDISQWREDGVGAGKLYLEEEIRKAGWDADGQGGSEEALIEAFERAKEQWIIDRGLA